MVMFLGKKYLHDINENLSLKERRWREIMDSLSSAFSIALLEADHQKILYMNALAVKKLGLYSSSEKYSFSEIFSDSTSHWGMDSHPSFILHTRHNSKPIRFSLIKKLAWRKNLYEIQDDPSSSNINPNPGEFQNDEAFISILLKAGPMAYYSYPAGNRNSIWYSDQIEALGGFRKNEYNEKPDLWFSRIHEEDAMEVQAKFNNLVPNKHVSAEYRWINKKGNVLWILDQAVMVEPLKGGTRRIVGSFMDITDRKEAESAVIENERNYREIFNSSNEAIFIHDPNSGRILDVNDTMLKMFRTTYENALSSSVSHFSHGLPPFDDTHAKELIEKTYLSGEIQQFNWISRREDQTPFWSEVTLKPIKIGGETHIMASVKNIDQKKKAEEQIKYQSEFEKLVLDISTQFINIPFDKVNQDIELAIKRLCNFSHADAGYLFLFDDANNTSNLNSLWQRKYMKFKREMLVKVETSISDWYTKKIKSGQVIIIENVEEMPESEKSLQQLVSSQGVGSFVDVPLLYQNEAIGTLGIAVAKPGRKWLAYEISLLRLTGQVFVNVLKRKESFQRLIESEEKYRHLVESQNDLIIKLSPEGKLLFVSPSYCEMFGFSEEELLGKKYSSTLHKDDQEAMKKVMESLMHLPHNCYVEQRVLTKKGWRWIAWNNRAVLNDNNKVAEIIGVGRDITYQKGVEEALRRSEDRFRSIVQHSSDIIFIVDKDGYILYDTPTVKKVLGYEEGALVGTKARELIYADDRESVLSFIQNVILKDLPSTPVELRLYNSENKPVFFEGYGKNMISHPSIQGIVVTLRDISERKLVEKKILDTVIRTEEQERERFAKNLHDDLGPLLSSIKMYVNSLDSSNDAEKQEYIITQLNEVVREAIQTTKEVSNDLSPHILMNYGLISAIENFLRKVPSKIKINIKSNLPSERFSSTIENSFYRIIKELINNTLKHAEASLINISLEETGEYLNLIYSDNGRGFDMNSTSIIKGTGMGISNIISRAKSLNGSFDFQTSPGNGFTFKISIPMHHLLD